jgi:hypothetical protein
MGTAISIGITNLGSEKPEMHRTLLQAILSLVKARPTCWHYSWAGAESQLEKFSDESGIALDAKRVCFLLRAALDTTQIDLDSIKDCSDGILNKTSHDWQRTVAGSPYTPGAHVNLAGLENMSLGFSESWVEAVLDVSELDGFQLDERPPLLWFKRSIEETNVRLNILKQLLKPFEAKS